MAQSWSAIRKQLEKENICDSLKGRIQYFVTRYRKAHDSAGRVAVRLDGREIFKSYYFRWAYYGETEIKNDLKAADNQYTESETFSESGFDQHSFYLAVYYYLNHSIDESLFSEDPLINFFAILDKRVGKRTLKDFNQKHVCYHSGSKCFSNYGWKQKALCKKGSDKFTIHNI